MCRTFSSHFFAVDAESGLWHAEKVRIKPKMLRSHVLTTRLQDAPRKSFWVLRLSVACSSHNGHKTNITTQPSVIPGGLMSSLSQAPSVSLHHYITFLPNTYTCKQIQYCWLRMSRVDMSILWKWVENCTGSDLKPSWNIHLKKYTCIYLYDGDSLPVFGWWSVGVGQTLSEQHCDLLQLLLSLLHVGILLQYLLQVRAARQVVLVEEQKKNSFKWHFTQSLNILGGQRN